MYSKLNEKKQNKLNDLASVASRTELYRATQWDKKVSDHNISNVSNLLAVVIMIGIYEHIFENTIEKGMEDFFITVGVNSKKVAIDKLSPFLVLIFLSLAFEYLFKYISNFIYQDKEKIIADPFDQNLLEEDCRQAIKSVDIKFYRYAVLHGSTILSMTIPIVSFSETSSPHVIKILNANFIKKMLTVFSSTMSATTYHLEGSYSSRQSILLEEINALLKESNINFIKSSHNFDYLETAFSPKNIFIENSNKFENLVLLERKKIKNEYIIENYCYMIIIKKIIEEGLGCTVKALDDKAMLISFKKITKMKPSEQNLKAKNAEKLILLLGKKISLANTYIKNLKRISENYCKKNWDKVFESDNENFFSFTLNVKDIGEKNLNILKNDLQKIFNLAPYVVGNKLVLTCKLEKKFPNYTFINTRYNREPQFADISAYSSASSSIVDPKNNNEYLIQTREETKTKKPKRPKINYTGQFFFFHNRKPKLISISWNKQLASTDPAKFFKLTHACSSKTCFYSMFTLPSKFFTEAEPKNFFIDILRTEVIKTGEAPGSAIKFLSMAERLQLKEKIQNIIIDPSLILFKLHTNGESRVYGVLRDEGTAIYDDGSIVTIKLIDWCIIDRCSHSKKKGNHVDTSLDLKNYKKMLGHDNHFGEENGFKTSR